MNEKTAYIYGRNAIIEALRSGKNIEKIFVSFGSKGNAIDNIFSLAKRNKTPIVSYDKKKYTDLEKKVVSKNENTQGVIALLTQIHISTIDELVRIAFEKES
jgi:23S rRNA (guanosine2251-2'-O)-methyltransferase